MITVVQPGTFTTVQDIGRTGFLRYGIPESGALDKYSLRCANLLIGNEEGAAGLEATLFGPRLKFSNQTRIAICGGDLAPSLNDEPINGWEAIDVSEGSELLFQGLVQGARSYMAFEGGISSDSVKPVMGSMSTYIPGGFGGFKGRALAEGDTFEINGMKDYVPFLERKIEPLEFPEKVVLRVLLGPQDDMFTEDAVRQLSESEYKVAVDSDRMGIRCEGPVLQHRVSADIISDGTVFGSIQVPSSGMPIILLADRGTTGGYAKIATVISADHTKLAQIIPGDTVEFEPVSLEKSIDELAKQENKINSLKGLKGSFHEIFAGDDVIDVVDEYGEPVLIEDVDEIINIKVDGGDENIEVSLKFRIRK